MLHYLIIISMWSIALTCYFIIAELVLQLVGIDLLVIFTKKPLFIVEHVPTCVYKQHTVNVHDTRIVMQYRPYMNRLLQEYSLDPIAVHAWATSTIDGHTVTTHVTKKGA